VILFGLSDTTEHSKTIIGDRSIRFNLKFSIKKVFFFFLWNWNQMW